MSIAASLGGLALLSTCTSLHATTMPTWPAYSGGEETTQGLRPSKFDFSAGLWSRPEDNRSNRLLRASNTARYTSSDHELSRPAKPWSAIPYPVLDAKTTVYQDHRKTKTSLLSVDGSSGAPQKATYKAFRSKASSLKAHHMRKDNNLGSNSGRMRVNFDLNSTASSSTWAPELDPKHDGQIGKSRRNSHKQIACKQSRKAVGIKQ
ncbi:hypothetical protein ElyMa_006026700 [Elysia marginata]|uniref:Secreted protein n=1 Tax=Elysia marginata TaxID=1093978 RepID=A0AAV4GI31_9GAST|nr:hypothetical protein ElyMa_006026700 [Elysia marginata]